jgi:hypothetical protein
VPRGAAVPRGHRDGHAHDGQLQSLGVEGVQQGEALVLEEKYLECIRTRKKHQISTVNIKLLIDKKYHTTSYTYKRQHSLEHTYKHETQLTYSYAAQLMELLRGGSSSSAMAVTHSRKGSSPREESAYQKMDTVS